MCLLEEVRIQVGAMHLRVATGAGCGGRRGPSAASGIGRMGMRGRNRMALLAK